MIGFKHEDLSGTNPLQQESCCVAQIGEKAQLALGSLQQKSDRIHSIVWHGKRLNGYGSNVKSRTGLKL